jgi:YVTN family beta-propeller protein
MMNAHRMMAGHSAPPVACWPPRCVGCRTVGSTWSGGDIYVANGGSSNVSVIDPSTNTVVATLDVGTVPSGVAVGPTGPDAGDIYVANFGSNTVSVIQP